MRDFRHPLSPSLSKHDVTMVKHRWDARRAPRASLSRAGDAQDLEETESADARAPRVLASPPAANDA